MNLSKPTPTTRYQSLSNYRDTQFIYQQYDRQRKSLAGSLNKLSQPQLIKAMSMGVGAFLCLLGLIFFDNSLIKIIMMFATSTLVVTTLDAFKMFSRRRNRVSPLTAKYLKSSNLLAEFLQNSAPISKTAYRKHIDFILKTPIPAEIWQNKTLTQLNLSMAQKADVETGLKDFFLLRVVYPNRPIMMPSQLVDELWHAFILDTHRYQAYCKQAFGELFHHVPDYQFQDNGKNIERFTWQATCRIQGLEPRQPSDIPRLFAIDKVIMQGMVVGSMAWLSYQEQMVEQYQLWQQKIFGSGNNTGMFFEDNGISTSNAPISSDKSHCDVDITKMGDCSCGSSADGSSSDGGGSSCGSSGCGSGCGGGGGGCGGS